MLKLKFIVFMFVFTCSLFASVNNFEQETKKNIKLLLDTNYEVLLINKFTLIDYYSTNNFKPFWIDEKGVKDIGLSLLDKIKNDPVYKPNSSKIFRVNEVINSVNSLNKSDAAYNQNLARIDLMLTELFDRYVTYISNGSIKWNIFEEKLVEQEKEKEIKARWDKFSLNKNPKLLLKKVVSSNDLTAVLKEIDFNYPNAEKLILAISELEKIASKGGYTKIPEFKPLKIGDVSDVLPIVRQRLLQSNDLIKNCQNGISNQNLVLNNNYPPEEAAIFEKLKKNCENIFDEDLKNAISSFQKKHGLTPDGVAGLQTQRFMNIPVERKISIIRLNLERMRWLPRDLGEKYLVVNIPEYRLRMYEHNDIKLNMAVIVGDVKYPTPIFSDKMSYVVLNPSWNIPGSIARNELIPKLLKDPNYLNGKGIDVYTGSSVGMEKVNQKEVLDNAILQDVDNLANFRFTQTSNQENPLGKMKFMFPNKHSVYIHDTPAKSLFIYARRAFSHGCIRLSKPDELLSTIASEDKNLNIDKAHEILANATISEKSINLEKKIPIHIVYLTSWVDENDVLQFREDIYNFDRMQKELLF